MTLLYPPIKGQSVADQHTTITDILGAATLLEKIAMMSGLGFFKAFREDGGVWAARAYRAGGGCERLGVPAFYFTDGPRGVARGNSTCFPCTMARGATFDVDLERRIGEIMGIEARAQDANLSGAVCVNLLRHPAWGRAQETYGEDSFHLGEMGAALAVGIQTHNVCATVKHYALNSIENARFKINVEIDARTLHEVYLPHFKRILDAGCASVMSAYNRMNGEYCGQHRELLTDILRHEWGFTGFVHSDWVMGVYQPYGASAGLDVENPEPVHFGAKLLAAVENGSIEPSVIDTACRRILSTLYRFACADDPLEDYSISMVASDAHIAVAHEAALKSAVLLKNSGALPLALPSVKSLGVFGLLADIENTGDNGSSRVRPPYVSTPLKGLADFAGQDVVRFAGDENDPATAAQAARTLDAAVIIAGYTATEEGEFIPGDIALGQAGGSERRTRQFSIGGDRTSLRLPDAQVALIRGVASACPRTIVVVVAGSAVLMDEWIDGVPAVLQTFYSGMEGGAALAKLLFGAVSPSGKLPFSVAAREADYPHFDKDADAITYGYLHGRALFEHTGAAVAFPFGHGLSYAEFAYRALTVRTTAAGFTAQVTVANTGSLPADEIIQLYVTMPASPRLRAERLLAGFARVSLAPGAHTTVQVDVARAQLAWRRSARDWVVDAGVYGVTVSGTSSTGTGLHATVSL